MNIKQKLVLLSVVVCLFIKPVFTQISQASISGTIFDSTSGTGKYWVWVSTQPLDKPLVDNTGRIILSSYSGTTQQVDYVLENIPFDIPIYVNAMKDVNPPFVEEYLSNPNENINPYTGDPYATINEPIVLTYNNPSAVVNLSLVLPPSGKISGTVHYYGEIRQGQKMYVLVFDGYPQEDAQPVGGTEITQFSGQNNYYPTNYTIENLPDSNNYYVLGFMKLPNEERPSESGIIGPVSVVDGGETTNVNFGHITGVISYPDEIPPESVLKLAVSPSPISSGGNIQPVAYREIPLSSGFYFPYFYSINFVPQGSFYVIAVLDDNDPDTADPYAQVGPMDTPGVGLGEVNFTLVKPPTYVSTITVNIIVTAKDANTNSPIANATVKFFYTNNNQNPSDDILVASGLTDSSGVKQFSNLSIIPGQAYYAVVEKDGYLSNSYYVSGFDPTADGQTVNLDVYLTPITVNITTSLTFEPQDRVISPDNDDSNDILKCKYNIVFDASNVDHIYDILVSLAIDVNKDGIIKPVEWNKFFWDNQGRIFIKKNPDDYIDYNNPDYSKLIGPISQDEYNRILATYDVIIDKWISKYDAKINALNKLEYSGELIFEGKDNAWAVLSNGTYLLFTKVAIYGYGLPTAVYESSTTFTIETAGIKGKVVDNNDQPVSGAKVSCSGPNVWQTVFTDDSGNFSISGLKSGDSYYVEIDKEGFVKVVRDNVVAAKPEKDIGSIQLQKAISISGNIVLPNPPLAGTIKDQWGNFIYDLWINIEAQDLSGGPWLWKQVSVNLPNTHQNSLSVPYSISVSPNKKYRIVAKTVGYVSKEVVIEVGTTDKTQDIELTKAVSAKGYVQLPTGNEFNEFMQAVNYKDFSINIWARSKDGKYNSWSNIWYSDFELTEGQLKVFYVDSLVPNTSYFIGIEGQGFAKQQKEVFIGSTDTDIGTFVISTGLKISGSIFFDDGVYEILKESVHTGQSGEEGIKLNVEVFDKTYRWVTGTGPMFISTTTIVENKKHDFTISGLENGMIYIFAVHTDYIDNLDVQPGREFKLEVTTSTFLDIKLSIPTGVVKGKLVNSTGSSLDWSKVTIIASVFGTEGAKVAQVYSNGEFMFTGMNTGFGVLWGSVYPDESSRPNLINWFGHPSGEAQLFAKSFYAVSGSTVDIGTIELKKPGIIEVVLRGSPEIINEIYQKEQQIINMLGSQQMESAGPWGFVRVQNIFLKMLAEEISQRDPHYTRKKEEIAIGLDTTISISSSTEVSVATITYTFNAAEEGFWDVYFAVGDIPVVRYGYKENGNWKEEEIYSPIAVYPFKQTVFVKSGETKQVVFNTSEGVNVEGVISRPVAGFEEVVTVYLKDKVAGKTVASQNVEFTSDKKTLSSLSFKFEKVIPGEYLLVVVSPNYKVYSREVTVPDGLASVTLPQIVLAKGANITGSLVDEKGTPITSGVFIECFAEPFVEGAYRNTNMEGNTISETGRFILRNLPQGTYTLRIKNTAGSYANYATLVKSGINVPNTQGDVDIGVISLRTAVEISGSVKDISGKPLPNVPLAVYPQDVQLRKGYEQFTTTDKDGKFVFKGINKNIKYWELKVNIRPEDPSKVIPELLKYAEVVKSYINVTKDEYRRDIDIVLPIADVSIKGKIETSDGKPLYLPFRFSDDIDIEEFPAALIILQTEKEKLSQDPTVGKKVLSDPSGNFVIKGVTKGKYTLKVLAKGYSMGLKELDITTSGEIDVGVITLDKGFRLSGTITTPTGDKVSNKLVNKIVATTKNYSDMVIGQVNYNPVTYEVIDYYIDGLKSGVTYYIAMIPENADGPAAVTIDPVPVVLFADGSKNLVYTKPKPHIELKSFKYKNINKDYLSLCIQFVKEEIDGWRLLQQINSNNYSLDDLPKHLFVALLLQDSDISSLVDNFDIFFIYGFISHPVTANSVEEIVSKKTASGTFLPVSLSESKQQFVVCYVANGEDNTRGYFELKVDVANYYGMSTQVDYKIYIGEDARVEKVVTPLLGGGTTIGEKDNSGIEIPSGTEFEGVDVSSPVNVVIKKLESSTVESASKLSPKMFSSKVPTNNYPGELVSSIYDMEVRLITGPLATLAQNNKVKLTIQISTSVVSPEEEQLLKIGYYNDTTNKWELLENIPVEVDFENAVVKAEVTHLSKFAVFKVILSTVQPYSGEFKTYAYPNPVKDTDKFNIRYCLPGSGKVKVEIKIYNIAGELVRSLETQEVDAGYVYDVKDIEVKNDKGEKLASGVYFYYIKAGDYKKLVKFAIIR